MQNHNTYPYFDDKDNAITQGYHKILFVPGNPVQARELTQIQSLLQEQVKRFGDHMFKNGTKISGGEVSYDNSVISLKVSKTYNSHNVATFASELIGRTLVGQTTGVEAHVVHYEAATKTEPDTLYIKYISSNETVSEFVAGEVLSNAELNVDVQIQSASTSISDGAIVTINDGIYYMNGYFVGVARQTLVLSRYTNTPSNVVGLSFVEKVVTSSDDESLLDNAIGFPNYVAPGAHRYQIKLVLTKKTADYADEEGQESIQFVSLLKVLNGVIQYLYNETKYAEFEKMLARRTYDESGDYVVKDFKISTADYRSDNRGDWKASTPYLTGDVVLHGGQWYVAKNTGFSGNTAPTHLFGEASDGGIYWLQTTQAMLNGGVYPANETTMQPHIDNEAKYVIRTSAGKAYVKGFEVNVQDSRITVGKKARDFRHIDNMQIFAPSGQYALVTNITGNFDTSTMKAVRLKNPAGTVIGNAWATTIEYVSGTVGTNTSIYKLYLFAISMNAGADFADDVLTVDSADASFSATFVQQKEVLSGVVSTTAASNVVNGKATLFTQELSVGDQIEIGGEAKTVSAIQSDVRLTVDTNMVGTFADVSYLVKFVKLEGVTQHVQPLPQEAIRTLRTSAGAIDTEYVVQKTIGFTASGTSHTVNLSTEGETFNGASGHILVDLANNAHINATYALDVTAKNLTISGITTGHNYRLISPVKRVGSAAREKTKTLLTKTVYLTAAGVKDENGNVINSVSNLDSNVIQLSECDVVRIISIKMSGATGAYNATGETNVISQFAFHHNQTVTHYGMSYLTKNVPSFVVDKELKITFEYFEHSKGDYFSVDSYSSIPFERIPSIRLSDGKVYSLGDCLDFRSRISDDGLTFSGTGGSVSTPIYSGSTISTSYSYYLPRIDVLSLTSQGEFEIVEGISKEVPKAPMVADGSLVLATLEIPAYTANSKNIKVKPTINRRYTMNDIGKIDDRLSNVEYYVALSQLERETVNTQILDANGLDRFKNGFIADDFTTLEVGEFGSSEVRSAIDAQQEALIPQFYEEAIDLLEFDGVTATSRNTSGYQVTGDWITLPYTEYAIVQQMIATRDEFINPFAVFSWNGVLTISPQRDDWQETNTQYDTQTIPGSTINVTNNVTLPTINQNVWGWWGWSGWGWNNQGWSNTGWTGWGWSQTRSTTTTTSSVATTTRQGSKSWTTAQSWDAPWMRSVPIMCELVGMRPLTKLYSFFSSQSMDKNLTPAMQITITGEVGKFLGYKDISPSNTFNFNRDIDTLNISNGFGHCNIFNKGELIMASIPAAGAVPARVVTAVVVSREVQINPVTKATETVLHVVLPRSFVGTWNGTYYGAGGFVNGMVITGQNSGATATISAINQPAVGNCVTNSNGNWFGYMVPPSFTFRSGEHEIMFCDSVVGDPAASSSLAFVTFATRGMLTMNTVHTRNWTDTIVTRTNTTQTTNQTRRWYPSDPLAQTFTLPLEKKDGVFITSADIFFSVKAAGETQPVRVEICEAVNGYPSQNTLPNAVCVKQASEITASTNASVATTFRFPGPVFLEGGKEYCLKVLTNSVKYKIFIAQMGEKWIQDPTKTVGAQPSLGVLFKSQNNSTWTPDQMQDMMFSLKAAKFDTSRSGLIRLRNKHTGSARDLLLANPFTIKNTSTLVKVNQRNHGLVAGMYVEFSGSTYTAMNGRFAVTKVVNDDFYYVTMAAAAVASGSVGGGAVQATKNIKFDKIRLELGQDFMIRSGTGLTATINQTSAAGRDTVTTTVQPFEDYNNDVTRYIHCDMNEAMLIGGGASLIGNLNIYSNNPDLSPMINRDAVRAVVVGNRINNPAKADNTALFDELTVVNALAGVVFTATANTIAIPTSVDIEQFKVGSYISISGTTNNNTTTGTEAMILDIDKSVSPPLLYVDKTLVNETPAATTIVEWYGFIDETAPVGGTSSAKYQTRRVQLKNQATAFKLAFAASIPAACEIEAYYRTASTTSSVAIDKMKWTKIPMVYKKSSSSEFVDQEYTVNALPLYDLCQVKLVSKSTNSAQVPTIKNLRVICLA